LNATSRLSPHPWHLRRQSRGRGARSQVRPRGLGGGRSHRPGGTCRAVSRTAGCPAKPGPVTSGLDTGRPVCAQSAEGTPSTAPDKLACHPPGHGPAAGLRTASRSTRRRGLDHVSGGSGAVLRRTLPPCQAPHRMARSGNAPVTQLPFVPTRRANATPKAPTWPTSVSQPSSKGRRHGLGRRSRYVRTERMARRVRAGPPSAGAAVVRHGVDTRRVPREYHPAWQQDRARLRQMPGDSRIAKGAR
jgi:hypothetical protein